MSTTSLEDDTLPIDDGAGDIALGFSRAVRGAPDQLNESALPKPLPFRQVNWFQGDVFVKKKR